MFTLQSIKDAHSKVKSGADFPAYVQELISLGLVSYDVFVTDGHAVYTGKENFELSSPAGYKKLLVANISDKERFKHYLKNHQRGQTDYATFCNDAATTGVEKWTVDTTKMTCTYYDKQNNEMLVEEIPSVK